MHYLLNIIRGALIGSAELVPGISGGTVALIVGIYERALHNANFLFKAQFRRVEWLFLLTVALGMFGAVFGLSTLLHTFVENQVSLSRALFLGMVTVSIIVPFLMISPARRRAPSTWIALVIAAAVIFFITGFTSTPVANPPLPVVFGAAAIAVCALLLPGVSGSLILLTMGLYQPVIGAVSERDWPTIVVFAAGALCGLAALVKLLNYLLSYHRDLTLAVMVGFMVGSLRALWPFGALADAPAAPVIAMIAVGAGIVGVFIFIDHRMAGGTESHPAEYQEAPKRA